MSSSSWAGTSGGSSTPQGSGGGCASHRARTTSPRCGPSAALERAEVAVVLVDAAEPLAEQDLRIVADGDRRRPGPGNCVQQVGSGRRGPPALTGSGNRPAAHTARWAPGSTSPPPTGWHVDRLVRRWSGPWPGWDTRVPTGRLNGWLTALIAATPPPVRGGKPPSPVRDPGRDPAAALRPLHDRLPPGRLPAVPGAPGYARSSASRAPRAPLDAAREKRSGRPAGVPARGSPQISISANAPPRRARHRER